MLIGWTTRADEETARHAGNQSFGHLVADLIKGSPRHDNDIAKDVAEHLLREWLKTNGAHVLLDDGTSAGLLEDRDGHGIEIIYDLSHQNKTIIVLPDQKAESTSDKRKLGGYFMRRCM